MPAKKKHIDRERVMDWLTAVRDPEIPVLNVVEMGIVRSVMVDDSSVTVLITPTYSGCPAMNAIESRIRETLTDKGLDAVTVKKDFSASWTTEWMTDQAREKLKAYGIAPPEHRNSDAAAKPLSERNIACPQCDSNDTTLQSEFGSTACKALFYCNNCDEAFEHFKCH
jgi:ring-1,2-phenylacetyl-CoA epoxidase subunit PaaD